MIIALEGIDGAGKSTQALAIQEYMHAKYPDASIGIIRFPIRESPSGMILSRYLASNTRADSPDTINILFCENRQEAIYDILNLDIAILDRYILSGCVYAECDDVTNSALARIIELDACLPKPDLTIYFHICPKLAMARILARNGVIERNDHLEKLEKLSETYTNNLGIFPKCTTVEADQNIVAVTRDSLNAIRSFTGL